jgi:hypothetical protein
MADFSWLNDIPDSEWKRDGHRLVMDFNIADFRKRSEWQGPWSEGVFDAWGATQERQYTSRPIADFFEITAKPSST